MKTYCPRCKESRYFGGNFCVKCGMDLINSIKCDCGEEMDSRYRFCPRCGAKAKGYSRKRRGRRGENV